MFRHDTRAPVGFARSTREDTLTAPFGHIEHDPQAIHGVDWTVPGIDRVIGLLFADAFGFFGSTDERTRVEVIDGRTCLVGGFIALDVEGIEDVDATVELSLTVDRSTTGAIVVGYDANGIPENKRRIEVPQGEGRWAIVRIPLERARFAGRGPRGTDILLGAPAGDFSWLGDETERLVVANVVVTAATSAPAPPPDAAIELTVVDETGAPAAARFGLYDAEGREVLPSDDAIAVPRYGEAVRQVGLRSISADESGGGLRELWPHANRWTGYLDGTYRVAVKAGTYDLILTKGPEYRWVKRSLSVEPGATCAVEIALDRWTDLPANGWASGDAHIHMRRDPEDDAAILEIARAEDVHIANVLQMGNVGEAYFHQYAFGPAGRVSRDGVHLVSGQEDPRTGQRGHTLHLNVAEPVRVPERYFLYHETFEQLRTGGALSGYAHVDTGWFADDAGLALDVPFGIVDLVEVLQAGAVRTRQWYDFLNLGYRLVPVAGSDWPYIDVVGTVRSYVHVPEGLTPDRWFDQLRAGHTFVTSGPMLTLDVNGASMGDQLEIAPGTKVMVRATARQSPDLGPIERLELIVHGEVVANGTIDGDGAASLEHRLSVSAGCWIAARAAGDGGTHAHTAPVYVPVAGATWNAGAAPAIADRMRTRLAALLASVPDPAKDLEPWDAHGRYQERWHELLPELTARVREANRRYDELLERIARAGS